jgi:hypothetical protein
MKVILLQLQQTMLVVLKIKINVKSVPTINGSEIDDFKAGKKKKKNP